MMKEFYPNETTSFLLPGFFFLENFCSIILFSHHCEGGLIWIMGLLFQKLLKRILDALSYR
jgi:hypothetical protein